MQFIYALCDPRTGQPRYIGCSCDPRRRLHQHMSKNSWSRAPHMPRNAWFAKLHSKGKEPLLEILYELGEGESRQEMETFYIQQCEELGFRLLNVYPGGGGGTSEGVKASWADPEKRAARMKGIHTPEAYAKRSAAQTEVNARPGMRERKSLASTAANSTPEARARASKRMKEQMKKPKFLKLASEGAKASWADPEQRAARSAAVKAATAAAWADPVKRAARLAKLKANTKGREHWEKAMQKVRANPKVNAKRKATCNSPEYLQLRADLLRKVEA